MTRKRWTVEEKLEVVLALVAGQEPGAEVCRRYGCSLSQAQRWREQAEAGMRKALADQRYRRNRDPKDVRIAELEQALGRATLQVEGLKKTLGVEFR